MSNLNWLLSIGATVAIIEFIWWIGIVTYVIKFIKKESDE